VVRVSLLVPGYVLTFETTRPDGVVIQEIDPLELKERLDRGDVLVLVDVREPFERALVDLPNHGQRHIPVKQIPLLGPTLDREAEIVFYCRSGPRSAWATEYLVNMGYRRVLNLRGGIMGWRAQVDPSLRGY
jgi:adenylyltransferase/sulfurtransferase